MACIPPNPRRVGYINPIHGPLYMGSHIHQHTEPSMHVILHKFVCSVKRFMPCIEKKISSTVRKVNNVGKILPTLNCTDIRNTNSNIPSKLKVNPPLCSNLVFCFL